MAPPAKPVATRRSERVLHLLFDIGVVLKGVDGILEIAGGVLLLLIKPAQLHHIVRILTQHELVEDPHDAVANFVLHNAGDLSTAAVTFASIYLLWHGVVKVGLVTGLLRKVRWAYPVAIAAFVLFLVYQMYRWSHTHASLLLVLSMLDVVVIALTWFEYRRLRDSHSVT